MEVGTESSQASMLLDKCLFAEGNNLYNKHLVDGHSSQKKAYNHANQASGRKKTHLLLRASVTTHIRHPAEWTFH